LLYQLRCLLLLVFMALHRLGLCLSGSLSADSLSTVCAGTYFTVGVVLYNKRSKYRRLDVREVAVDSFVSAAFDSEDFSDQLRPFDVLHTGQLRSKCINGRFVFAIMDSLLICVCGT